MNYFAQLNSTSAAVLDSNNEVVVKQEVLEELFEKEWLKDNSYNPFFKATLSAYGLKRRFELSKIKDLFISELAETTKVRNYCQAMMSQNFNEHDLVILAKLMSLVMPNCPLSAIDEIMAEWMPPQVSSMGVVPYLAHLAKQDYAKAKRMFYRYLAEKWSLGEPGRLFLSTVRPYIKKGGEVDFAAIVKNNDKIYDLLLGVFTKYLNLTFQRIKTAEFSVAGKKLSFAEVAKSKEQEILAENKNIDAKSALYKRCFWQKTLRVLQEQAQEAFSLINEDLGTLKLELDLLVNR